MGFFFLIWRHSTVVSGRYVAPTPYPWDRDPGVRWIGCLVGSRAGLDVATKCLSFGEGAPLVRR